MPCSREEERDAVALAADAAGARALFALLVLPPAEARRRIAAEAGHDAPDRTPDLVDAVAARFAPAGPDVLRLDATLPAATLAAELARAVR
jgi:predicted kinase